LEICGGNNPLSKDHLNVDILDHPDVDVVTNLHNTLPFRNNEITKIYSIATLEHFTILDIGKILREFHRILKDNGTVEIGVPSLKKIMQYYNTHGCDEMVIRYLHGAQKDNYDIHLCILDFERFKEELEKSGFTDVRELDYSLPFHEKEFMMQISARKG
jgi:predicted SAM-dependent methyltransferase